MNIAENSRFQQLLRENRRSSRCWRALESPIFSNVRVLTHVTLRHALSYILTHDCLNISTRKVVRAFLMIYQCTWSLASLESVAHFAAILLLDKFRNDAQPRRGCVICILASIPSPLSAIILLFIDHFLDNQLQVIKPG